MKPYHGELTLGRWLRDRAVVTPERVAIDHLGRETTYAALDARSEGLAAGLLASGLDPGARVATLTGNLPEHVEVLFACAKAGLTLVPVNRRLAPAEITGQLADAQPSVLLCGEGTEDLAAAAVTGLDQPPLRHPLTRAGLDDLGAGRGGDARTVAVTDDDPLLIMYTSGTTGRSKGVVLTHANCFWTNLSLDRTADLGADDVVLQVLPQFHVGGWNVQPLLAWWKGATVVLEPAFDAGRALDLIERRRITTMMGVPATYLFMAEHERFDGSDLSSLRYVIVGGAPMPESLLARWADRGVAIMQGYGLTEAAPNVLCLPREHARRRIGYAGRPYPHVDVALRDPVSGAVLSGPARGELCVRGPNVFPGYWRNDAATAAAFSDGWLRTGDIAERDDEGFYRIRDRLKDMYISGGENVYPAEIEAVLHAHPDVVEAAVIGVPDQRWGEVGVAFVVVRSGAPWDAAALSDHCRQRLAGFKVPRAFRRVAALPRSAVNKVLKTQLRSWWRQPEADGTPGAEPASATPASVDA